MPLSRVFYHKSSIKDRTMQFPISTFTEHSKLKSLLEENGVREVIEDYDLRNHRDGP